ncbi:ABC transporter ATP-binding protein [Aerococcus urinaeequi]|uniref:ABC transporter ATP-binding protein n=1 Tax=Aerococcus urinaeequi TaxID=51665 RepID=A0AAF0BJY7_9LACT|nr:ABC transporter ATP-binding protein [Aerococcus urinaeequi]WCG37801.1 ABC transporter ATP-binding protein [Aerococcus urinaeequi]
MSSNQVLLEINHLHTGFRFGNEYFNAVDDVTLTLNENEVLAIVGESGSGKSTLATSIVGLHNRNNTQIQGEILYRGNNLLENSEAQFNKIRGNDIGMIFQDPLGSLNPLMTIKDQIEETLLYHSGLSKSQRLARVEELLTQVQIPHPKRVMKQYPHELSGGMRQRVVIAIALANKPSIIIADEPTTALDVTVQAQILDLMNDIQDETGSGILLITHDLGVVAQTADRVAVMYAGEVVEIADVFELFNNPKHPYTRSLLNSVPHELESEEDELHVIQGSVPSLQNLPRSGCRFASRIPWFNDSEHEENPTMHELAPNHFVKCTCWQHFHFPEETDVAGLKEGVE